MLLLSLRPQQLGHTVPPGARHVAVSASAEANLDVSSATTHAGHPPTEAPLLKRANSMGLRRDAGQTYGGLLMLDLSFRLLIAQGGIEVHLWFQEEQYNFGMYLDFLSFSVLT